MCKYPFFFCSACPALSSSLSIPAHSETVIREQEFIEATSRITSFNVESRPGVPLTPIEIRLTKDRLSLISRVLSSNSDAYKYKEVILELVDKLGFRGDVVARVKTLAMIADTALQAEDFAQAFETSEAMINTVSQLCQSPDISEAQLGDAKEVCWVSCFQLGRQTEFPDVPKKLRLLGHALEFCPADRLPEILAAWRRLEKEDIAAQQHTSDEDKDRPSPPTLRVMLMMDQTAPVGTVLVGLRWIAKKFLRRHLGRCRGVSGGSLVRTSS